MLDINLELVFAFSKRVHLLLRFYEQSIKGITKSIKKQTYSDYITKGVKIEYWILSSNTQRDWRWQLMHWSMPDDSGRIGRTGITRKATVLKGGKRNSAKWLIISCGNFSDQPTVAVIWFIFLKQRPIVSSFPTGAWDELMFQCAFKSSLPALSPCLSTAYH